jgi:diguanylate cyclase (GGDEF)-like protein/PAS domain S-box-containing protein
VLRAVHDVAIASAKLREPSQVARLVVDHACALLAVDGGVVYSWDAASNLLQPLHETESSAREPSVAPGEGAVGKAYQSEKPVVVSDYRLWKHALPQSAARGMVSALAVPLFGHNRPIGVLGVWTYKRRRFSAVDVQLLSLFAAQVAPALASARLAVETEAKARAFHALHEVAVAAGGVLHPKAVSMLVVHRARQMLGADGAALCWWNPVTGVLDMIAYQDIRRDPVKVEYGSGEGAIGMAHQERRAVIVEDYPNWKQAVTSCQEQGIASTVAVPLITHGRASGVLTVWTYERRHFEPDEVQLLSLFAAQAAPPIESAHLVQEREAQIRTFRLLYEVAVAASGVLEPAALARLAVDRARDLVGADASALYWWDAGRLHPLADNDISLPAAALAPPGHGTMDLAFQQRKPVVVGDYRAWPEAHDAAVQAGVRSTAAVPLLVGDVAVGALGVRNYTDTPITPEHVELLALMAALVAPALETARLVQERAMQSHTFQVLHEVAVASGGVLEPAELAQQGVNRARALLHIERAAIYRWDPGQGRLALLAESDHQHSRGPELLRAGEGAVGLAFETVEPVVVDDYGGWDHAVQRSIEQGVRSVLAVPLLVHDRPVGALVVMAREQRAFAENDVQVLSLLAAQVTPALEAARLHANLVSSEAALRESEGRFRAVFNRAGIGIAWVDLEGRIIEANPALQAMLGYDSGTLVGMDLRQLMLPDDARTHNFLDLVDAGHEDAQLELRYLRRDGGVVWGNSTASLLRDDKGEPLFVIALIEDISDRKAQEAQLEHQALHDALTDLPNRVLLHDRLDQAIKQSKRDSEGMALMVMDLDRFKEVNDTFGHHSGDDLLCEVARRLQKRLRSSDTVARLGGDEFAMVLPGVGAEAAAAAAARKLLKAFDRPFEVEGETLEIGASLGIALYPTHGAGADTLLQRADVAMYAAKRGGGGYAFYAFEDDQNSPLRMAMVGELRQAIENGELKLHYQPMLQMKTRRVVGAEALVRWPHPQHGLLAPDQFIPLAEQTGLIRPLSLWVLDQALRQCAEWRAQGHELSVAVNLSMRNVHDPQLPETVERLLAEIGLPGDALRVEITESTLMAEPELAWAVVSRLHGLGVQLAIDDFGIGYSSLAYLKRLPAGELKIDRSFVIDMVSEESDAVIVRSTIELGHNLGLQVVGEGVETRAAWDMLERFACDYAQGNYISAPLPPEHLTRLLPVVEWPFASELPAVRNFVEGLLNPPDS